MKPHHVLLTCLLLTHTPQSAGAVSATCDSGFKRQLARITIYIDKVPGADLASALQDSMKVYDTCAAGDDFSAFGKWKDIADRLHQVAAR